MCRLFPEKIKNESLEEIAKYLSTNITALNSLFALTRAITSFEGEAQTMTLPNQNAVYKTYFLHAALDDDVAFQMENDKFEPCVEAPHIVRNFVWGLVAHNPTLLKGMPTEMLQQHTQPFAKVTVAIVNRKIRQSQPSLQKPVVLGAHYDIPASSHALVMSISQRRELVTYYDDSTKAKYNLPAGCVYRFCPDLVRHSARYFHDDGTNSPNISIVLRQGGGPFFPTGSFIKDQVPQSLPGLAGLAIESLFDTTYNLRYPDLQEICGDGSHLRTRAKSVIAQALSNSRPLGVLPIERQIPFEVPDYRPAQTTTGVATLHQDSGMVPVFVKFRSSSDTVTELKVLKGLSALGFAHIPHVFGLAVHPDNPKTLGICMELLHLSIDDVRLWRTPSSIPYAKFHPTERPHLDMYLWMITEWVKAQDALHALGYVQCDVSSANIMVRIKGFERINGKPCLTLGGLSLCLTGFRHANAFSASSGTEFYQWFSWMLVDEKTPSYVTERFGVAQTIVAGLLADATGQLLAIDNKDRKDFGKLFRNDPTARTGNWLLYWFTHKPDLCPSSIHGRLCARLQKKSFRSFWTDDKVSKLDEKLALGPIGEWAQLKWDKI